MSSIRFVLNAALPLQSFLDDPQVVEIMINGESAIFVERQGRRPERVDLRLSKQQIDGLVANLANISRKSVDLHGGKGHSVISARLPGFRIEAQLAPVALEGPYLCIRRHSARALSLDDYVRSGLLPQQAAEYLARAVSEHRNIIVAGGTSTGKTTFLNALIGEVDRAERLLAIETVAELVIPHENVVRLEADDEQGYSVQRLLKSALRSRPDRIIVGEVRGGEAFDLMDAANTGHPGAMASLHANSAIEALSRLENLVLEGRPVMPLPAIRQRIAQTFELIVHMQRSKVGDEYVRRLGSIVELSGIDPDSGHYRTHPVL